MPRHPDFISLARYALRRHFRIGGVFDESSWGCGSEIVDIARYVGSNLVK